MIIRQHPLHRAARPRAALCEGKHRLARSTPNRADRAHCRTALSGWVAEDERGTAAEGAVGSVRRLFGTAR
ncbi:MAG: hypothetical protein ING77_13990 [Rhodocyclaceae bacterium]|jgi:hypothetical protein|nr:hypothetical protein [Rhodocyclaceae bacterium]